MSLTISQGRGSQQEKQQGWGIAAGLPYWRDFMEAHVAKVFLNRHYWTRMKESQTLEK